MQKLLKNLLKDPALSLSFAFEYRPADEFGMRFDHF